MVDQIHSTGRGGAGNIGEDPNQYTEAGIVREGFVGEGRPDYSSGRGGAGNIVPSPRGTPNLKPQTGKIPGSGSEDIIPETNMRSGEGYENYHTGRGGQGNVHKDKYGGHSTAGEQKLRSRSVTPEPAAVEGQHKEKGGLLEKAKEKLGLGDKKDTGANSPLRQETGAN